MKLVLIHGASAAGKLTTAKAFRNARLRGSLAQLGQPGCRGCASCSGMANSTHKASPHENDRSAARNVHVKIRPSRGWSIPGPAWALQNWAVALPGCGGPVRSAFAVNGEVLRPHLSASGRLGSLLL